MVGKFGRKLGQDLKKFYRWQKSTDESIHDLSKSERCGNRLNAAEIGTRMPRPLQLEALNVAGQLDIPVAFDWPALFGACHRHRPFPIGNPGAARGA